VRTENSAKNILTSWGGQILMLLLKLVARNIFVSVLSEEYLGVNGLFSNILSMLSLAELGIGTAIIYSLYKPIEQNDTKNIAAIMQFYKKVYLTVGVFVAVIGTALTPFLSIFIKDMPDIKYLQLIYILFVMDSAVSYFFSYKATYVEANQKNYIVTIIKNTGTLVLTGLQIAVLLITKNFILYIAMQAIMTLVSNTAISMIADKMYPVLKSPEKQKMDPEILKKIKQNTGAMVFHKAGGIIVFSTSSIVLSKWVGLAEVGLYSNYCMIISSIEKLLEMVFSAITASVGNLAVATNEKKTKEVFDVAYFTAFWLYSFCGICLLNLINPFIAMWVGEEYLVSMPIVIVFIANFYIKGMRKPTLSFNNAMGIFWYNRYMPIFESGINIVVSIILAKNFGMIGVFIGTLISSITTCVWNEPYVLFKYGFKQSVRSYFDKYLKYLIIMVALCFGSYFICNLVTVTGILGMANKLVICLIVPNVVVIIMFYKTFEFKYLKDICFGLVKKMLKKKES